MGLRALTVALAIDTARAYSYLRLNNIIAGTGRVSIGIPESQYPVLLVLLRQKDVPRGGR